VAHYIEHEIKKVMPDFDMEGFVSELQSRHDIDSEIYELVSSLTDCKKFQEVIDDYKNVRIDNTFNLFNFGCSHRGQANLSYFLYCRWRKEEKLTSVLASLWHQSKDKLNSTQFSHATST